MCRVVLQASTNGTEADKKTKRERNLTKYVLLDVYHFELIYLYIKYPTMTIVTKSLKDFSIKELKS